ncbi:MAG: HisA/HisF-related TIM barrel protein, partial [Acidimicrobiia bacterium]
MGHPVPPREVGPHGPRHPAPLRRPLRSLSVVQLFPAIDLRGGQVVRLHRGDYASETVYGRDPVAVARR